MMAGLGEQMGFDVDTPWRKLPAKARKAILEGCDEQVHVRYRNRYGRTRSYYADFEGVMAFLQRQMEQTDSETMKERYEGFMRDVPCPECDGTRLKPEILAVTLAAGDRGKKSIAEVSELSHLRLRRVPARPHARAARAGDRRAGAQGDPVPARVPARRRARLPVAVAGGRQRCPAVRHNAFGSPPRSAPVWSACSTCSTSRRSACISATTAG